MAIQLKYLLLCFLLFFWGCGSEMIEEPGAGTTSSPDYSGDDVYKKILNVKFTSVPTSEQQVMMRSSASPYSGFQGFDELAQRFGTIVRVERLFPYAGKYESRLHAYGLDRWYQVEFQDDVDLSKAITFCSSLNEVEYIQPEFKVRWDNYTAVVDDGVQVETKAGNNPFDDPYWTKQWHYDYGGLAVTEGSDIGLFTGWKVTAGDPSIIVAVVDQGVDYKHEDLAANMWVNKGEIPDNGIDDDNNGFVDDIYGYNFYNASNGAVTGCEHGTHVAGTIAAVNNNKKGVCGIAGGSGQGDGVRIMSCQVGENYSDIRGYSQAIVYAANNGAVIAQCSWMLRREDQALKEAINFFVEYAGDYEGSPMKGGIIFFAAGNERSSVPPFPAAYDKVVSVAATNQYRKRASYSNYGDWVKISAPGGERTPTEMGIYSTLPNSRYGYMNGTSQACPHVSGIAALVISAHIGTDFTNDSLKKILYESVADLSTTDPNNYTTMGKGLLRADLALWHDDGVAPEPVPNLSLKPAIGDQLEFSWTMPADMNDGIPARIRLYLSLDSITVENLPNEPAYVISVKGMKAGEIVTKVIDVAQTGKLYYAATAVDLWGNVSALSNVQSFYNIAPEPEPEPDVTNSLVLYPNPVGKELNVKWTSGTESEKQVFIYDMSGKKVLQDTFGRGEKNGIKKLDVSRLSSGKYVVKFQTDKEDIVRNILKVK